MGASLDQRAFARTQSFTSKAVAVLVLYWVFWLPGLIANIVFYREARRMERLADASLPGTGCLAVMLMLNLGLIILGSAVAVCVLSSFRTG
jgi:hypothetical protein